MINKMLDKLKKNIDFFKILYLLIAIGSIVIIFAFLGAYFILKKGSLGFMVMSVLTFSAALIVSLLILKNKVSISSPGKMRDRKTQIAMGISAIIVGVSTSYITVIKSNLTVLDIIFSALFILGGISLMLKNPEK